MMDGYAAGHPTAAYQLVGSPMRVIISRPGSRAEGRAQTGAGGWMDAWIKDAAARGGGRGMSTGQDGRMDGYAVRWGGKGRRTDEGGGAEAEAEAEGRISTFKVHEQKCLLSPEQ